MNENILLKVPNEDEVFAEIRHLPEHFEPDLMRLAGSLCARLTLLDKQMIFINDILNEFNLHLCTLKQSDELLNNWQDQLNKTVDDTAKDFNMRLNEINLNMAQGDRWVAIPTGESTDWGVKEEIAEIIPFENFIGIPARIDALEINQKEIRESLHKVSVNLFDLAFPRLKTLDEKLEEVKKEVHKRMSMIFDNLLGQIEDLKRNKK